MSPTIPMVKVAMLIRFFQDFSFQRSQQIYLALFSTSNRCPPNIPPKFLLKSTELMVQERRLNHKFWLIWYNHQLVLVVLLTELSQNNVYQTRCSRGCSINTFVIHWFSRWSFCSESSRHCLSLTKRAGELTFWDNVHPQTCVTCQVSGVRCQVSGVRCQVSGVTILFIFPFIRFSEGGPL